MKALDLFAGLGGRSDGLALEGFEVLGVEIEPKIAKLYKHKVIVQDVKNLKGKHFKDYDLIVGSPPCRDFSDLGRLWGHTWKRKPDPKGLGMELVNAFLRVVEEAQPKFWLMENVTQLEKYFRKARVKAYLGVKTMRRCFWGNFPSFLIPQEMNKFVYKGLHKYQREKGRILGTVGKFKSWERARIPLCVSRALGRAVKQELINQ